MYKKYICHKQLCVLVEVLILILTYTRPDSKQQNKPFISKSSQIVSYQNQHNNNFKIKVNIYFFMRNYFSMWNDKLECVLQDQMSGLATFSDI